MLPELGLGASLHPFRCCCTEMSLQHDAPGRGGLSLAYESAKKARWISRRCSLTYSLNEFWPIIVRFPMQVMIIPTCSPVTSANFRTAEKRCSFAFPCVIFGIICVVLQYIQINQNKIFINNKINLIIGVACKSSTLVTVR